MQCLSQVGIKPSDIVCRFYARSGVTATSLLFARIVPYATVLEYLPRHYPPMWDDGSEVALPPFGRMHYGREHTSSSVRVPRMLRSLAPVSCRESVLS